MKKISNIHPGEILKEEFLIPFNISAYRLAKDTNIPPTRISQIIKGKRSITADTALRFSKYFGTTPDFWLGLQMEYDLREEKSLKEKELKGIKTIRIAHSA
ncbi:MAG: addiction module antidote protein, HigA family [Spirochaetae bacterium HGW-Spirochaetae-1]|jgi:addiction module HigA family antidote|nr:MAG: addiction module antidote protein, HigA family [Spirochaetae bacterium HGW-Spirochaetae-1]